MKPARLRADVLAGLVVFGYAPGGLLWLGAALIVAASAALWWSERLRAGCEGQAK